MKSLSLWLHCPADLCARQTFTPNWILSSFKCVRAETERACSRIAQWDFRVHPAPGCTTSICFLWGRPSCGKITAEHLGEASALFRSHSTLFPALFSTPCCVYAQCAAFNKGPFLDARINYFCFPLFLPSLFVYSCHFLHPCRICSSFQSSYSCCFPPSPAFPLPSPLTPVSKDCMPFRMLVSL